ncbi:glycosyltransferase family 2 protein [Pseudomonas putida]|uniref:Glycosyltransferase family 2 protein n=1 Tax=Pseudomonas putida TaxID=303 RepID=A0A7Y7ZG30_PSEPU|nr:glycosyltransferase family 2 protein [Pseudomonas putida]NWC84190.1 glycosyltransferase family 2 protein [Pseudomonas putida]
MDMFHRHRQANEHDLAAAVLERALCTPEYRPEALVWKGIAALPDTPGVAFVYFANAANSLPDRADIHALVGRSLIAQNHFELATRYLTTAWQANPNDITLRMMLWQARSRSEAPGELRRMIMAHLPEIQSGNELAQVLKLLAEQTDAPRKVGVVRYTPEQRAIHGWAVDLANLQAPAPLHIEANGMKIDALANAPHPLLTAAGLPASHGGVRVNVPNPIAAVHMRFADGTNLQGSPVFAMPPFVPPAAAGGDGMQQPVDVLIPVYNGLDETLECINSVLNTRKLNRTAHRLVVIEDQTPVPALAKALKVLAGKGKITLVNNAVNLGFIRSMNRAMALSPNKDVVWLNADTRVHGAWLDRLRQVAYSEAHIASVTPFTNNGELMSFPRSQFSHAMPSAAEQAELDNLACNTASPPVEIETGCGFCLYIKRAALDQVGYLDEVHLSRGYGEETDWCLRARNMGWKHVGAPNVFVAHQGGISFGTEKNLRVAQNNAILRQRYPDASDRYKAFCLLDPIKPARDALQRARIAQLAEHAGVNNPSQRPSLGKKTLYVRDSAGRDTEFRLTWHHDTHRTWVTLQAPLPALALLLDFELPRDFASLVDALRLLPQDEIVFDQLSRCPVELCSLPALLDRPYRVICRDRRLLEPDGLHDWQRFAQQATCVQLPWRALHDTYANALPGSQLTIATTAPGLCQPIESPRLLLIGDNLNTPDIGHQWLELARHIVRNQLPMTLVATADTPWLRALQSVGSTQLLPELQGFTFAQLANSAGCDGVLSLVNAPDADWLAPNLAAELNLPLYAKPGPLADELGATPINRILSLSQA